MTNFFNAAEDEAGVAGSAQIGREEWLRVAHEYKIPCHIDAAADMPPISNLWKYTGMGFDLVSSPEEKAYAVRKMLVSF